MTTRCSWCSAGNINIVPFRIFFVAISTLASAAPHPNFWREGVPRMPYRRSQEGAGRVIGGKEVPVRHRGNSQLQRQFSPNISEAAAVKKPNY
jgi:hypothetical protein